MHRFACCVAILGVASVLAAATRAAAGEESSSQIFERRVRPILDSPAASSCAQCHLGGVDLKHYLLPTAEKTFVSLRDQGLIDLENPERSKILALIKMGEKDKPEAARAYDKKRQAEFAALRDWLAASCRDPKLRDLPKNGAAGTARPSRPVEVIRHERKDRLLESFVNNVWAMRFRCMSCHIEGTEENNKFKKEFGERVAWIKAAGPEATMDYLLRGKLVDVQDPAKSLLLRKPLMEVEHKGGKKFLPGDLGYKAFRTWLEDYANIKRDRYTSAGELPNTQGLPERFGTDIWLKLNNTPPEWGDKLLQVTLFAWDAEQNRWEDRPIAESDRGVWGKGKLWQHNLTLLAAKGSVRDEEWRKGAPQLRPGRYLVKIYVDRQNRTEADWRGQLSAADLAGQVEVRSAWPAGYGSMTVAEAPRK
jgi:hypothetical protein